MPFPLPLVATECVRVVVDYGTLGGTPGAPNTHCTNSATGDTAAAVLARRATETGNPPPRYHGNFLCGIDGYPESGCGDENPKPYWSFWVWLHGRWEYSSIGVDSYTVSDADRDGHPDPIGFRYHEVDKREQPRPGGGFPSATPTPRPTPTPAPTRAVPSTAQPTPRPTRPPTTALPPITAAATVTTAAPPPTPTVPATPPTEPTPTPVTANSTDDNDFPAGTVAGGLLAAALLGAAAWRARRPGAS